jgi:23S rRNA (guanosine2251-2'-O)-methyltransferase
LSDRLFGIHPVLEAIRARPRSITRLLVAEGRHDGRVEALLAEARGAGVSVQRQPRRALDRLAEGGVHQGVVALVAGASYADADEIVGRAGHPPLLVVLDGVEDPRNLGAVARSAAAAGADGLIIPARGAAGLTPTAVKASAGAVERLPIAQVGNIVEFLKRLKKSGLWVVGLDPGAPVGWSDFDMTLPLALVLGGEGKGLRRLARDTCDAVVSIPMRGGAGSLNLSVAAGVVLFEAVRQRLGSGPGGRPGGPARPVRPPGPEGPGAGEGVAEEE